jgi:multisubunit Na+/H+ antiporter MnhF subunit
MTGLMVCALVLLLALVPALGLASYGEPLQRLIGLELVSGIGATFMLVLALMTQQSYYLSVPLVLVPLSFAGTLVFTRLLGRRSGE